MFRSLCPQFLALVQVGVSPENGPEIVERAARALGIPADTVFRLRLPEGNPHQLSTPPACAQHLLPDELLWWTVPHADWWSPCVDHSFCIVHLHRTPSKQFKSGLFASVGALVPIHTL